MFERDHVGCAARRRHVLRIGNRQVEDPAEAGKAHAVVAFELNSPGYEYII